MSGHYVNNLTGDFSLCFSEHLTGHPSKQPLFLSFHAFLVVNFRELDLRFAPFCLSSLVGGSIFFKPKCTHFTSKNPLFDVHFAPVGHMFHGSRRFYLYDLSGCLYFSSCVQHQNNLRLALHNRQGFAMSSCVQHQNNLRLTPKQLAFSTKIACVQHQNALHLAPKHTPFYYKQPVIWRKWLSFHIKIHFAAFTG